MNLIEQLKAKAEVQFPSVVFELHPPGNIQLIPGKKQTLKYWTLNARDENWEYAVSFEWVPNAPGKKFGIEPIDADPCNLFGSAEEHYGTQEEAEQRFFEQVSEIDALIKSNASNS